MILTWTHNQETGELTCVINDELKYVTSDGGGTLFKHYRGDLVEVDGLDEWEDEKHWLSDNFSSTLGVYAPQWGITEEQWAQDHPEYVGALPLFGLTPSGHYLDKLQRPAWVQEGEDMRRIVADVENKMMLEIDDEGVIWQRPWCEELDTFYNIQPCCVFPNNPGRQSIDQTEAREILEEWESRNR